MCSVPAVYHHGAGVGQGFGLDSPNEAQQARGVVGYAVVWPACEVELSDLADLVCPSLRNGRVDSFHTIREIDKEGKGQRKGKKTDEV